MAKAKEIKYNTLSKTANSHGVYYFTKDNINYIGNAYAVIRGMNDDEFKTAIDKAKAEKLEREDSINIVVNHINMVKNKGLSVKYTKFCFNTVNGLVHFFKMDNGTIINLYDKFYSLLKDQKINKIIGLNSTKGVVFELTDGKDIMILPMKLKLNEEKADILEKVFDIL